MTIPRISRIEAPGNRRFSWFGLYHIWTEQTGDQPIAMSETRLNMVKFENEMLQQGVSEKMIEKYKELVMDYVYDEQAMYGESV